MAPQLHPVGASAGRPGLNPRRSVRFRLTGVGRDQIPDRGRLPKPEQFRPRLLGLGRQGGQADEQKEGNEFHRVRGGIHAATLWRAIFSDMYKEPSA